jgi:hypothetical protein
VPELEGIVDEHPLREQLRGQLMLALYRSGRQADALARFREGRELLVRTLGLEPGPSLRGLHEAILRQDASLEAPLPLASTPALVVAGDADALELFAPVARRRGQELLLVRAVSDIAGLDRAVAELEAQRALLVSRGLQARIAAFRSDAFGRDLARLCERADADLAIIGVDADAARALGSLAPLLQRPPCDVALLVADHPGMRGGPVVVAFGGSDNDWAALELGVALAQAHDTPLVLAGGSRNGADSSRALAAASLAVQRVASIVARPVVVPSGSAGLRAAAEGATALVLGLPDDWRERGIGRARAALLASPPAPTALVRRGLHVWTLGADESVTQFTWSR